FQSHYACVYLVTPRTPRSLHHPLPASSPRHPAADIVPRPPPDNSPRRASSSRSSSSQSLERRSAYPVSAWQSSPPSAHGSALKPRPLLPIFLLKTASVRPPARSSRPYLPSPRPPRTPLPRSPPFVQCRTPPVAAPPHVRIQHFCFPAHSEPAS